MWSKGKWHMHTRPVTNLKTKCNSGIEKEQFLDFFDEICHLQSPFIIKEYTHKKNDDKKSSWSIRDLNPGPTEYEQKGLPLSYHDIHP